MFLFCVEFSFSLEIKERIEIYLVRLQKIPCNHLWFPLVCRCVLAAIFFIFSCPCISITHLDDFSIVISKQFRIFQFVSIFLSFLPEKQIRYMSDPIITSGFLWKRPCVTSPACIVTFAHQRKTITKSSTEQGLINTHA